MDTTTTQQELCIIRHQGPLPAPSQQSERQACYYKTHKQELAERFAGQWICIDNEEVVECAATEGELLDRLNNTGPRPDSLMVCVRPDDGTVFLGSVH